MTEGSIYSENEDSVNAFRKQFIENSSNWDKDDIKAHNKMIKTLFGRISLKKTSEKLNGEVKVYGSTIPDTN